MAGSFLDTVLAYLAQSDAGKAERIEQLLGLEPIVSVQVLNELANVLRRKAAFSWSETRGFLTIVRGLTTVVPLTPETHDGGPRTPRTAGANVGTSGGKPAARCGEIG